MGHHDGPMRLASAEIGGNEVAVVLWAGGALPPAEVPNPDGWPTGLLSLLEGGRLATCAWGGTGSPGESWRSGP
jgi:hypothetical protein